MSELLPTVEDVVDGVLHGTFCPKMCNHVCPVFTATGRHGAAPWGLHTLNAAVIAEAGDPGDGAVSYADVRGCTGCHACEDACLYDLDVPREVRAIRARLVDRDDPAVVRAAVEHVRAGRSPDGRDLPSPPRSCPDASVTVLAGCGDPSEALVAVARLLDAADVEASFHVPDGCCGRILADLGASEQASQQVRALGDALAGREVVAIDPHCIDAVAETGASVTDVWSYLAALVEDGRLRFAPGGGRVTFHDPCVLARDHGVISAPRRVLGAAGLEVTEPEGHGRETVCSGAGMAFALLDEPGSAMLAARRRQQLDAVGLPALTACSRARTRLSDDGWRVTDALVALADRLHDED